MPLPQLVAMLMDQIKGLEGRIRAGWSDKPLEEVPPMPVLPPQRPLALSPNIHTSLLMLVGKVQELETWLEALEALEARNDL